MEEIVHFYSVYHSARWVGEQLVLRLNKPLPNETVSGLNTKFADILRSGEIVQGAALRQEKTSPHWQHYRA